MQKNANNCPYIGAFSHTCRRGDKKVMHDTCQGGLIGWRARSKGPGGLTPETAAAEQSSLAWQTCPRRGPWRWA